MYVNILHFTIKTEGVIKMFEYKDGFIYYSYSLLSFKWWVGRNNDHFKSQKICSRIDKEQKEI